jgi:uncharacterized membrane protein (DUF485 family)
MPVTNEELVRRGEGNKIMVIGILAVLVGVGLVYLYVKVGNKGFDKRVDKATRTMANEIERQKKENK